MIMRAHTPVGLGTGTIAKQLAHAIGLDPILSTASHRTRFAVSLVFHRLGPDCPIRVSGKPTTLDPGTAANLVDLYAHPGLNRYVGNIDEARKDFLSLGRTTARNIFAEFEAGLWRDDRRDILREAAELAVHFFSRVGSPILKMHTSKIPVYAERSMELNLPAHITLEYLISRITGNDECLEELSARHGVSINYSRYWIDTILNPQVSLQNMLNATALGAFNAALQVYGKDLFKDTPVTPSMVSAWAIRRCEGDERAPPLPDHTFWRCRSIASELEDIPSLRQLTVRRSISFHRRLFFMAAFMKLFGKNVLHEYYMPGISPDVIADLTDFYDIDRFEPRPKIEHFGARYFISPIKERISWLSDGALNASVYPGNTMSMLKILASLDLHSLGTLGVKCMLNPFDTPARAIVQFHRAMMRQNSAHSKAFWIDAISSSGRSRPYLEYWSSHLSTSNRRYPFSPKIKRMFVDLYAGSRNLPIPEIPKSTIESWGLYTSEQNAEPIVDYERIGDALISRLDQQLKTDAAGELALSPIEAHLFVNVDNGGFLLSAEQMRTIALLAQSHGYRKVARMLGITEATLFRWRERFITDEEKVERYTSYTEEEARSIAHGALRAHHSPTDSIAAYARRHEINLSTVKLFMRKHKAWLQKQSFDPPLGFIDEIDENSLFGRWLSATIEYVRRIHVEEEAEKDVRADLAKRYGRPGGELVKSFKKTGAHLIRVAATYGAENEARIIEVLAHLGLTAEDIRLIRETF